MRLVLVGPPGSGKGTQGELLVRRLGLTRIGTGDILRHAIQQRTPLGRQVEPLLRDGRLVPDAVVNALVAELLHGPDRPRRFVMDGYPRTHAQAVAFDALLARESLVLDAVIDLAIPDDEVVRRVSGRWCCANVATCGVCYHLTARPPRAPGVCDRCGFELVQRPDDCEETVRRRLEEFHKNTDALVEHYRGKGLLREVAATDPAETIYQKIVGSSEPEA